MGALSVKIQNIGQLFKDAHIALEKAYKKWQIKNRFDLGCIDVKEISHINMITKMCKWDNCNLEKYIKDNYGKLR